MKSHKDRQPLLPTCLPAHQDVRDGSPLDGSVAAEGKARLSMDVLGVSCIGAIVALIDGHIYPSTFWMILKHTIAATLSKQEQQSIRSFTPLQC